MHTAKAMSLSAVLVGVLTTCLALSDTTTGWAATPQRARPRPAAKHTPRSGALACGDLTGFQVLLDREGFSPGQIDGKRGVNFSHALSAFQAARELPPNGLPDCGTWKALVGDTADPTVTSYTVTEDDVKGPFERVIPKHLAQQVLLKALAYQSPLELLAERFHASPALLNQLNRNRAIAPGRPMRVPAVKAFEPGTRPTRDAAEGALTVAVSREESAVRVTRADGTLLFFAPVSSGSLHDPLPIGDYKVRGVDWHPKFHYNPDLFWDAKASDEKATIRPGPNNPVGIVWIALDLDHYGIHGTPEPSHVGHTESHGCVRLTNWDAQRLASMVKPGTAVQFR